MYPIFALYEPKEFKCLNDARFDLQNFRMRFLSISDWPRMFEYLCHWLTNQRDSLKTLLSQNQTENESETSFQFNGKEGICSETCEKFLTRSRRNAAPAAAKKDRFHTYFLSLEESEVDDQSVVTISWPIISFGSDHVMKSCVGGRWIMLFQEYWIFYWKIWLSSMFRFWKLFLVTKYESEIVTKRWLIGMVWQFQLSRWFNQCDTCNRTQFNLSRSRLVFKLHLVSEIESNQNRLENTPKSKENQFLLLEILDLRLVHSLVDPSQELFWLADPPYWFMNFEHFIGRKWRKFSNIFKDILGRKNVMFFITAISVISLGIQSVSPNLWAFTIFWTIAKICSQVKYLAYSRSVSRARS